MTDPDNFLSRWSHRKQNAAKQASLPAQTGDASEEPKQASEGVREPEAVSPNSQPAEPAFDLSKLPPLESIGPQTDVSVFMQPGVPASLSHAALRRAWSADPAIRDFIGLSENSWDFTAPEGIPGFGPLLPMDDVKRMVGQIFNDRTAEILTPDSTTSAPADGHSPAEGTKSAQLQQTGDPEQGVADDDDRSDLVTEVAHCDTDQTQRNMDDAASQQARAEEPAGVPNRRRHGGALPT